MSIILNKYVGGISSEVLGNYSQMCEVVPVQTNIENYKISNGYYCMVIDNSGSMHSAATVTTDDGDKVNHGWSILDIAKHSINTFIQSLDEGDHVKIINTAIWQLPLLNGQNVGVVVRRHCNGYCILFGPI